MNLDDSLEELEWSVRTSNVLKRMDLSSIRDLTGCSALDLLREPNFGRVSLLEVREMLSWFGWSLRDDPPLDGRIKRSVPREPKARQRVIIRKVPK